MARSLRWRLQAWHGLILLVVVAGFGSALYLEVRRARLDEIDGELIAAARVLEGVLRSSPPRALRRPPPPDRPPPAPPPGRGRRGPRPEFLPPPGEDPRNRPPPPPGRPPREPDPRALSLPSSFELRYGGPGEAPYAVIWLADGERLNTPSSPETAPPRPPSPFSGRTDEILRRQRGPSREVVLIGPEMTQILVGRPIGRELAQLGRLAWQLSLTGLGVFGAGLVGGWWLSGRAVRPIDVMSRTAAGITASSLSRRIDLAGVDREFGRLGVIFNDMLERLEAAFERQVRFTADASHELRTPLSVILSHADLALSRERSAEEYRDAIVTCRRASRRMKSLVDDLLILARADAGELELKPRRVDLLRIAEENAELMQALAARRDVAVAVSGESVAVSADPDRLAQVVTNLLNNAILYNKAGGSVTLTTSRDGAEAVLRVSDTGIGIPEDDRAHVFDRFYRVDRARSRETGGSGLGLAICKSLVEAHGGTISFASAADAGTTFVVRLPIANGPATESA